MINFEDLKVGMKVVSKTGEKRWDGIEFPITITYVGGSTYGIKGNDGNEDVGHSSGYGKFGNYIKEYKEPVVVKHYMNVYSGTTMSVRRSKRECTVNLKANEKNYKYTIEITETDGVPSVKVINLKDE